MSQRTIVEEPPATPHFDFLFGFYRLSSNWRIPYFATTMTIRHAAESLRLTVEFPGAEAIEWRLDELFQRDLDWPRVERKILPYLHAQNEPQFFNSLTVALVPIRNGEMTADFSQFDDWSPPSIDERVSFSKVHTVGPIRCGYWDEWSEITDPQAMIGKLRWNPSEVFSVALDGQHRLAAIKQFIESPGISQSQLDETRIPIILLVLDQGFGYRAPVGRPLVDVLRKLFIDLNKHAKTVSRARQILLDDQDPTSVCVRSVVGDRLCDGVEELEHKPPRLPLSLVDWHTEQAKFDEGPYLTTTLGLDWIITSLLRAKPIGDFTDYPAINRQIGALERSLMIDLTEAKARLDDLSEVQLRPFSYLGDEDGGELETIGQAFQRVWNPAIVQLLTKLRPYEELLDLRAEERSFTLDFVNWYVLKYRKDRDRYAGRATDEYKRLLGRLQSRTKKPVGESRLTEALTRIESYKRDNLAFNVVFQRAYFLAFNEFQKVRTEHLEGLAGDPFSIPVPDIDDDDDWEDQSGDANEWDKDWDEGVESRRNQLDEYVSELASHERHVFERSMQFVRYINAMIEVRPELLKVDCRFEDEDGGRHRFWLGTIEKPEGGIDFTQGASKRASEVIFWVCAMNLYDDIVEPDARSDFDDFWAAVSEASTGLTHRLAASLRRFSDREASAGARILKTREQEFDKVMSREEARRRMEWIWKSLGL